MIRPAYKTTLTYYKTPVYRMTCVAPETGI